MTIIGHNLTFKKVFVSLLKPVGSPDLTQFGTQIHKQMTHFCIEYFFQSNTSPKLTLLLYVCCQLWMFLVCCRRETWSVNWKLRHHTVAIFPSSAVWCLPSRDGAVRAIWMSIPCNTLRSRQLIRSNTQHKIPSEKYPMSKSQLQRMSKIWTSPDFVHWASVRLINCPDFG